MIFLTIFNFIEAVIFKSAQIVFGQNSKLLRYTKIIAVSLISLTFILLAVFISKWFLSLFGLFIFGRKKEIDQQGIQDLQHKNEEYEANRISNVINPSLEKVNQIDEQIREAEKQTANVRNRDYSNVSNDELRQRIKEKVRNR